MIINRGIFNFKEPFALECGEKIESFDLVYETYGELNKEKSNAILLCHAFSGDHHAAGNDKDNIPGWWDQIVGSKKAIDTDKYFVVCSNNLGGCSGSTGPLSIKKSSGEKYGKNFPKVSINDWVKSQKMLSDFLEIDKWLMVVGGSLGGMQALEWAITYPNMVKKAGIFAAAARSSTQNIAMNEVARESIRKDPNFHEGNYIKYNTRPKDGIKAARMLGHITYLSEDHMDNKFGRKFQDIESKVERCVDFEVENYLQYKGKKFSESFDANSYILMTKAMDNYNIGESSEDLEKNLENIKASMLIIGFDSDWLYPPEKGKEIQIAAINNNIESSYVVLDGQQGHDSFLFSSEIYDDLISRFLES
tara:strand:+ start:5078 stop:6166 length:1089 start_codon:yes stop_codon:yes gene_type:complete